MFMKSTKILQKINENSDYYKIIVTEETNRNVDSAIELKAQKGVINFVSDKAEYLQTAVELLT